MDSIRLTHDRLSVDEATQLVTAPTCGAVSIFVGTTRDNFENKKVVQLEYESYDSMAEKVMKELCTEIRSKWTVENIAIFHRLGIVPVCEASVIIAISSEHRGEALAATQYAIHALKASVPIWKKEVYDEASGSDPQWKENKECTTTATSCGMTHDFPHQEESKDKCVPENLIQIKATPEEVNRRIDAFIARKREDVNRINVRDFCSRSWQQSDPQNTVEEESCARVSAVLVPRKDSKSHLRVRRVVNTWGPQTTGVDPGSLPMQNIKEENKISADVKTGISERLSNIEEHLQLRTNEPIASDIYARLKQAEERILYLESISPEYFSIKPSDSVAETTLVKNQSKRKKVYTASELRSKLAKFTDQQ